MNQSNKIIWFFMEARESCKVLICERTRLRSALENCSQRQRRHLGAKARVSPVVIKVYQALVSGFAGFFNMETPMETQSITLA